MSLTILLAGLVLQGRPGYTTAPASFDGIGKFYCGREIAQVMGHQAAGWLDRPEREKEEAVSVMIRNLGLKPGMVVADIGAGSGTISFPMAKLVGPTGKVLAVEIQQEMLDIIAQKAAKQGTKNVKGILGTIKDPKIGPASADLMLLVDVYHEFDYPYEMVTNMVKGLKRGGKLVLVEYRGEDENVPIKELHKMTEAQVRKEMGFFPLKFVENKTMLPWQHLLVFEKR